MTTKEQLILNELIKLNMTVTNLIALLTDVVKIQTNQPTIDNKE